MPRPCLRGRLLPDGMEHQKLYRPTGNGYEQVIGQKIAEWESMRARKNRDSRQDRG